MDFDDHSNFAVGDVSEAPDPASSGTTLTLSSGQGPDFPTPPFNAVAYLPSVLATGDNSEIVRVTNIVGDELTIVRAQESTVARSIAVGWRIAASITKKTITDIEEFVNDVKDELDDLATELDEKSQVSLVRNETPGGAINGSNTAFTVASQYSTGSLRVYKNGVRMKPGGNDFTEVSGGFTMVTAPATNTVLLVDYEIADSSFSVGTNSYISDEAVTGLVNGSNAVFTTARAYVPNTLEVFVNGLKQTRGTHLTETTPASGTFTLDTAPQTGDIVRVNYQYNLNPSGNSDTVDGIHASVTATPNQLLPLNSDGKIPMEIISNPARFSVYRNAAQALAGASTSKILFDSEIYDDSSLFNTTLGRFVADRQGLHHFSSTVTITNPGTGIFIINLIKNGSLEKRGNRLKGQSEYMGLVVGGDFELDIGDYVEVHVYNSNAGTASVETGGGTCFFDGHFVGA